VFHTPHRAPPKSRPVPCANSSEKPLPSAAAWRGLWGVFDLAAKEKSIGELESAASKPGFWDDSRNARRLMQELAALREQVGDWRDVESGARNLAELAALAVEEADDSLHDECSGEFVRLSKHVEELEFALQLSGDYDDHGAILAVKAGAGGTDAQDWTAMLLRMYLRWAERRGFKATVFASMSGEEAGIKSAVARIDGRYAYGYLKADRGVHRLVRLSPFDSAHLRHTSFALVEVLPDVEDDSDVTIAPDDLKIDTFRAGGHGGQNVQKNATAVRMTHEPTGIVVSVQNERSLSQNKEIALKILHARLTDLEMQRRNEERARLRGEHVSPEWGRQVRSYVLHPYRMVKDHRTDFETSDTEGVLDGDLDGLLKSFLASSMKSTAAPT